MASHPVTARREMDGLLRRHGGHRQRERSALIFGNEFAGISAEFTAAGDEVVSIRMSGFAQSLNISVAAAICLDKSRRRRLERLGAHGDLEAPDRERLKAVFTVKSVRHSRKIIERAIGAAVAMGELPAPG